MKYQMATCGVLLFAALGCGAAEGDENVDESQSALLLVSDKVLRMNSSGRCIEQNGAGWKTVNCTSPYPFSKKWDFDGDTASGFRVRTNAGYCIVAPLSPFSGITLQAINLCGPDNRSKWTILPGSGSFPQNTFQLRNVEYPGWCITEDLVAGGTLVLTSCVSTFPAANKQRLLVDNF